MLRANMSVQASVHAHPSGEAILGRQVPPLLSGSDTFQQKSFSLSINLLSLTLPFCIYFRIWPGLLSRLLVSCSSISNWKAIRSQYLAWPPSFQCFFCSCSLLPFSPPHDLVSSSSRTASCYSHLSLFALFAIVVLRCFACCYLHEKAIYHHCNHWKSRIRSSTFAHTVTISCSRHIHVHFHQQLLAFLLPLLHLLVRISIELLHWLLLW